MIEHRPVINLIEWVNRRFAVGSTDKLLFTTSICFDLSVYDMFGMLAAGGAVRIALEHELADPARLLAILADERITFWDSAPAAFSQLQPLLARAGQVSPHLRLAFFSGDWIALELPAVVQRAFPHCQVVSLGGATEATVWSNYYPVGPLQPQWTSIPYGKPIANARYYVLDRHLRPCPVNVEGDLYIGGACLAAGYWNRPALSAERFIPDPFASTGGAARMYRTGDRARYWADGNLEFLGRSDGQVKVRGYRIELGEIEARLGALDGVREAVVLALPGPAGHALERRLVAYLVASRALAPADLRAALLAALPEYMVPGAYVQLERLPLTANGKVDRAALPAPDGQAVAAQVYDAPRGPVEQVLAHLWGELLGLEQVGRDDHFFALGGHSLLVVGLAERLRERGLTLQVRDVFTRPVLADLATVCTAGGADAQGAAPDPAHDDAAPAWRDTLAAGALAQLAATVPGGLDAVDDVYLLAPLQEAMLVHHVMGEAQGSDAYLMRLVLETDSRARAGALLVALQSVIDQQPVLRTTLRWRALDEPLQAILRTARLDSVWLDVAQDDCADMAAAALARRTDPRTCRMALDGAPLIRAFAVQLPDGRCQVALLYHHVICDHVTLDILMEQVGRLMREPGALLPRARPYRHYVQRWRAQPAEAHRAWFTQELGDVTTPSAPCGLLDTQGAGAGVAEAYRQVPAALAQRLVQCARQLGTSPAVLFHVAWARVLTRLCHRDDVVFGTVMSGRLQGEAGSDRALGVFINALPLRVRFGGHDARTLVERTRQSLLELIAHEQATYALAQQCSGIPATLPLFAALLNYRHAGARDGGAAGMPGVRSVAGYSRTNFPLSLDVDEHDGSFGIGVECVAPLAPQRIAGYVLDALEGLAAALAAQPGAPRMSAPPFIQAPLLGAASLETLASAWDAAQPGGAAAAGGEVGAQVFAAIAQRLGQGEPDPANPSDLALTDEDGEPWTRARLAAWVDAMALVLRDAGVAPRTRVRIDVRGGGHRLGVALALLAHGCAPVADANGAATPHYTVADRADGDAAAPAALLANGLDLRIHAGAPDQAAAIAAECQQLARALTWLGPAIGLGAGGRFGIGPGLPDGRWLRDALAALHAGATLVCAPAALAAQGPDALYAWIAASALTVFSGDAAQLRTLVRARPSATRTPALRSLVIGGGALFSRDVLRWRAALPGARISHVSGPAASAGAALCWHDDGAALAGAFAPLGRPLAGVRVLLCDRNGEPMFPDEPGRLHLRLAGTGGEAHVACPDWVACAPDLLVTVADMPAN